VSVRPWRRGTAATRLAATNVPPGGELAVDTDTGNVVATDGVTPWNALKRLVRVDEVTTAVQQYVSGLVVTAQNLLALAVESGYLWAVTDSAGRIAIGVQPDGTAYIAKLNLANNSVSAVKLDADTQSRLVRARRDLHGARS
jgi:hypothetical protein